MYLLHEIDVQADILEHTHSNTPGAPTLRENSCFAAITER